MRHKLKLFTQPYNDWQQFLDFVERQPINEGGALITVKNGTTIRSVLKACSRELDYLNEQLPCKENIKAIEAISQAIDWLDDREGDRKARGVEGFHLP